MEKITRHRIDKKVKENNGDFKSRLEAVPRESS